MTAKRVLTHQALEIDGTTGLVRKTSPPALDLHGIAKGYGMDRLADTLAAHGIGHMLVGTMDLGRGAPLIASPASVTAVAWTCADADAWATALVVKRSLDGAMLARRCHLNALFIDREGDHLREARVERLFEPRPVPERVT